MLRSSRRGIMASRVTFIWDEKGILRAVDRGVNTSTHGADLAKRIAELKS